MSKCKMKWFLYIIQFNLADFSRVDTGSRETQSSIFTLVLFYFIVEKKYMWHYYLVYMQYIGLFYKWNFTRLIRISAYLFISHHSSAVLLVPWCSYPCTCSLTFLVISFCSMFSARTWNNYAITFLCEFLFPDHLSE